MSNPDRAGLIGFVVALVFIAFVAGAVVILTRTFPYPLFNDAYKAAAALINQSRATDLHTETHLWRVARSDRRGVTLHNPERAFAGYTLYTSGDGSYAQLIDMEGQPVHRWELDYRAIWSQNPAGREPRPADRIYWDKVRLFPNGDLAVVITADNDTPWGYGLIRIDRDSRLLWGYHAHVHHDLDLTPDGRIVTLTHEFTERDIPGFANLERPWLDDFLVVLDAADGRELSKVSLAEAFLGSPYAELLYQSPIYATADPLHANSVDFLTEDVSRAFAPAGGRPGQVLISFRNPSAVALVDAASGELSWGLRGSWMVQHDARALPNGNFTLFDNVANYAPHNRSRVLEVNPATNAIVWSYTGTEERPFDSAVRSSAETLANGNRIVTESDGARIFEVAPDGVVVWEFVNPVRGGDGDRFVPVVSSGQRIAADALDADFRQFLANRKGPANRRGERQ